MELSIPSDVDSFIQHKTDLFTNKGRLILDSKQHTLSISFTDTDNSVKHIDHQFIITGPALALNNEKTMILKEKIKLLDKVNFYLKSKGTKLEIRDNQLIAIKDN